MRGRQRDQTKVRRAFAGTWLVHLGLLLDVLLNIDYVYGQGTLGASSGYRRIFPGD